MKKLIVLLFCAAASTAHAQSLTLGDVIGGLLGAKTETAAAPAVKTAPPSARALGDVRWLYSAPAVSYAGSDQMMAMAVTALKPQILAYYDAGTLKAGHDHLLFAARGGSVQGSLGGQSVEGTYRYTPSSGELELTMVRFRAASAAAGSAWTYIPESSRKAAHGVLSLSEAGVLSVQFDVADVLAVARAINPKLGADEQFSSISAALEQAPGIRIGAEFKR